MDATLWRSRSKESEKAAKMLKDNNIPFTEIFADPADGTLPFLLIPSVLCPFTGIGQITIYAKGEALVTEKEFKSWL